MVSQKLGKSSIPYSSVYLINKSERKVDVDFRNFFHPAIPFLSQYVAFMLHS